MHNLFALTTADSEYPLEIPHNTAFDQGLRCLLRQERSFEKELQFYLEIVTCGPSYYAMDHSKYDETIQREESISAKRVLLITLSTAQS